MSKTLRFTALALLAIVFAAGPASSADRDAVLRYRLRGGESATRTIVVRGRGCLDAEDMTRLRLIEYGDGRAVYRCVQP